MMRDERWKCQNLGMAHENIRLVFKHEQLCRWMHYWGMPTSMHALASNDNAALYLFPTTRGVAETRSWGEGERSAGTGSLCRQRRG